LLSELYREKDSLKAYARGLAGGVLFGTPLLFTMEMWWLGFSLPPEMLLATLAANFVVLLILEHFSGFREDTTFLEEVQDAVVSLGLGMFVSVVILGLINVIRPGMGLYEFAGKVLMETVAISIGISVAMTMLGENDNDDGHKDRDEVSFWGNQAEAVAGAVFFALNVAATEEPMMIGLQMTTLQSLILLVLTILTVFAITYSLEFSGGIAHREEVQWWNVLLEDSFSTCFTAISIAAGALFLFGRIDADTGLLSALQMTVALGFPTALGAAFARLLI